MGLVTETYPAMQPAMATKTKDPRHEVKPIHIISFEGC
jgi:hypothetical protein